MANKASKKSLASATKSSKQKSAPAGSKAWGILAGASAMGAATVAKKVIERSWRSATGRKPPSNPADPAVGTWEAVTWAVATSAGVALARVFAQRQVAAYQARSALPEGSQPNSARTRSR